MALMRDTLLKNMGNDPQRPMKVKKAFEHKAADLQKADESQNCS
ncbi:hypothetical protein RCG24_07760 [Neobacillus sp. OS1-32]|nr:hypothetical protein [Neobacillus sp. OS1-32]WML31736.1 hypothetical protein RCG24_07760 [Neobacillus sp. OS1-32]